MERRFTTCFALACLYLCLAATAVGAEAFDGGSSVVVIYNTRVPESKEVANYYASRRQVPPGQVFGLDLPVTESMSRVEFIEQLQTPLLRNLEATKLFTFGPADPGAAGPRTPRLPGRQLVDAKVRYAALCYGVPTRIVRDEKLVEEGIEQMPAELRRNESSVDSQLACLPLIEQRLKWAGPVNNPWYGATNRLVLHPTNGILLVSRLDGPSAAIARGLVDKAMEAETNGLWGRAYFDSCGMTNGGHKQGDDWIRGATQICRRLGFDAELDESPGYFPNNGLPSGTLTAGFPLSHVAFYAGWYDWHVSGPFTRPTVEFMPGAIAYHLHSFNAQTIRSPTQNWVGPLLQKGATATIGSVDEPYLSWTPDLTVFFSRLIYGRFSLAEAAWAAMNSLSWQNIVVGDPLYRPFVRHPAELHHDLEVRGSKLVEWSHLRAVNLNLALGAQIDEAIGYLLGQAAVTRQSAVLTEKLADLHWNKKKISDALDYYEQVLKLQPSPQQRVRVLLTLGKLRGYYGRQQAAYDAYQTLLKDVPDYPDALSIYQKMLPIARALGKKDEIHRCEQEIKRLAPAPPPTGKS